MQLEEECKNMESNNIAIFKFIEEDKEISLNLDSPNFSEFVKQIINNNYKVDNDNILVSLSNQEENNIDIESLKEIVIEVHNNYKEDLTNFYKNIESEISTYYNDDEQLLKEIQNFVKQQKENDIEPDNTSK